MSQGSQGSTRIDSIIRHFRASAESHRQVFTRTNPPGGHNAQLYDAWADELEQLKDKLRQWKDVGDDPEYEVELSSLRGERDEWRTKALDVENHPVVMALREERDALKQAHTGIQCTSCDRRGPVQAEVWRCECGESYFNARFCDEENSTRTKTTQLTDALKDAIETRRLWLYATDPDGDDENELYEWDEKLKSWRKALAELEEKR